MAKKNLPTKQQIRVIVKCYDLILTFDSALPNELIEKQTTELIGVINTILQKHLTDSIPQLGWDAKKKPKISVVPFNPEDYSDE